MFPTFRGTRCREKKGGWIQELFPTHPTYQNPIFINPGPLLCKVSWFFGFSNFQFLGQTILKSLGLGFVGPLKIVPSTKLRESCRRLIVITFSTFGARNPNGPIQTPEEWAQVSKWGPMGSNGVQQNEKTGQKVTNRKIKKPYIKVVWG